MPLTRAKKSYVYILVYVKHRALPAIKLFFWALAASGFHNLNGYRTVNLFVVEYQLKLGLTH